MVKTEAEQIAHNVRRLVPKVKAGSLRIWGQWFGRPHDNIHTITGCQADDEAVQIFFNEGETLTVWNPRGFQIDQETFTIQGADRIRWEWYSYGRPKAPETLYYEDYRKTGDRIDASTNVDWYTRIFRLNPQCDAVEIL